MAEFNIYIRLVYILFVACATSNSVPKLKPYTERTLNDGKLCHPLEKKGGIDLLNERNSAVIVRPTNEYKTWQRTCKYAAKAPKGESLIVAIQNMYLRTNGSECLDYIKFKKKDGIFRKICGQIDRRSGLSRINVIHSDGEVGRKNQSDDAGEFDPDGEIQTTIHLDSAPLLADENLDLTVVYTPYKECRKIKSYREDYREIKVAEDHSICMWKEYFCDTIQNCVSVLCRDEEGCPPRRLDYVSDGTGTKVTIGAVTTMLLCFIIFVMSLWICRRHKKFCWSSDCAGPSPHDDRSPRSDREAEDTTNPSVAVSPMLEFSVPSSVPDKDLPPSYDSLFPEQSNPSTT